MISGRFSKIGEEQESPRGVGCFYLQVPFCFLQVEITGSDGEAISHFHFCHCSLVEAEIPPSPPRLGPKPGHSETSFFWITIITLG